VSLSPGMVYLDFGGGVRRAAEPVSATGSGLAGPRSASAVKE